MVEIDSQWREVATKIGECSVDPTDSLVSWVECCENVEWVEEW